MNNNYIIISLHRASSIKYGGGFFPEIPFYERGEGCKRFGGIMPDSCQVGSGGRE